MDELKNPFGLVKIFPLLQVKLPMLLSKPKKCYKSVSKTDLMADQQNDQEEDQKIDIFAYEEMNITQDSVSTSQ